MTLENLNTPFDDYQAREYEQNAPIHADGYFYRSETPDSVDHAAESQENAAVADDPKPAKKPADPAKRYVAQMAQMRRLARKRRDDPAFPWDKWGDAFGSANRLAGNKRRTRLKFALCAGEGVFDDIKQASQEILNAVQDGINRACERQGAIKYSPEDLSRKFHVTCAERHRLKLWQIAAIDATPDECRAYGDRQREKKRANAERARANRAAANPNYTPREDSAAAEARRMGVKENTLQAKLWRWKKAARKAAEATELDDTGEPHAKGVGQGAQGARGETGAMGEMDRRRDAEDRMRRRGSARDGHEAGHMAAKTRALEKGGEQSQGESRVEPALKTSRFRTRKPIGSSCVRNLDNNSRAATAKAPVNQASRAKSNFAKMRVFRRLRSTPDSRLTSAVTKTQKLACEAPPVSSADNWLGAHFERAAPSPCRELDATPKGAALAVASFERAFASITRSVPRSMDGGSPPRVTSAHFAKRVNAKRLLRADPDIEPSRQFQSGALRGAFAQDDALGARGGLTRRATAIGSHFPSRLGKSHCSCLIPNNSPSREAFWLGLALAARDGGCKGGGRA